MREWSKIVVKKILPSKIEGVIENIIGKGGK